jgi:hypothetical protein
MLRLPSRYEDLDPAFRGRLRPNRPLIGNVQRARSSMRISGGIRFLPIFGRSGCGKTSAARELSTHLPQAKVFGLSRAALLSEERLLEEIAKAQGQRDHPKLLIAAIDQYEESGDRFSPSPSQFVERLSLLDRGRLRETPILFLWLTTNWDFHADLVKATKRNERILLAPDFELVGPEQSEWSEIVEETFAFHNHEQPLADFGLLHDEIEAIAYGSPTLGTTIQRVGEILGDEDAPLQDLSQYQVVMLWPVTDGLRIARVSAFTNAREGYKLDWNAFYRTLNDDDKKTLPLTALNRARLYFDVRLVPIAAADLHALCGELSDPEFQPSQSYLDRFKKSHFFSIVNETWDPSAYSPLRERESDRAERARKWYDTVATEHPVQLGRRIARCMTLLGLDAEHEQSIRSPYSTVRADVAIDRWGSNRRTCIVELKALNSEGTRPSSIKDAIRTTLKRHAQFSGFLPRQ